MNNFNNFNNFKYLLYTIYYIVIFTYLFRHDIVLEYFVDFEIFFIHLKCLNF